MALIDKLTAIADKIRSFTGDTATMTLDEKVENEQKVYDAGYDIGYDDGYENAEADFWTGFVKDRKYWTSAFRGWGHEYICPSVVVKPTTCESLFYDCVNLKAVESQYFDTSNSTPNETSYTNGNSWTFYNCKKLEYIEDIGIPSGMYHRTFENDYLLKTIAIIRTNANCKYNYAFNGCSNLVDIYQIEGEIGQNGFDVSTCTKLSHDTLLRIINALADYSTDTSGTSHSITLGATNLAKLTEEEINIATSKGWSIT